MPIYRGPDGKIIEERTRKQRGSDTRSPALSQAIQTLADSEDVTKKTGPHAGTARTLQDNDDTGILRKPDIAASAAKRPPTTAAGIPDDDRTVSAAGITTRHNSGSQVSTRPTGWLSIIAGPGAGTSLPLGYGANSIGRADSESVPLNYGDNQISRQGHAVVTYDPRGRTFYLQSGSVQNLTYLNEQLVLTPTVLEAGAHILIGETTLHFTPLCGPDFDWLTILRENNTQKDKPV